MTDHLEPSRPVVLLGPQQAEQTVAAAVGDLGLEGPLATVTAGWEDREGEDSALSEHLGGRTTNLGLFPRAEDVFEKEEDVRSLMYEQHDRRRELQSLYRMRLAPQLAVCRDLFSRTDPGSPNELIGPELDAAIEGVRALDDHHLRRISDLDSEIADRLAAANHQSLEAHREELAEILSEASGLLIAGGNVGTMLNRLRLFDVLRLGGHLPIVAWAAGAMVVSRRIVLFHDSPPQGPGDAEVYAPGLDIVRGVIPLPHATARLRLDDPARVALFARRFAPDIGLVLDGGDRVDWASDATGLVGVDVRILRSDGAVGGMAA